MENLIKKIEACETMPELDELRMDCVLVGKKGKDTFVTLQQAFIKKKNQLKRIPLRDRNW